MFLILFNQDLAFVILEYPVNNSPEKISLIMEKVIHKSNTRGHANLDWLNTFHSFSFASYFNPERINFGKLRVLNDDVIKPGMGFGKHPHDNMEIITVVLQGELEHKDSMDNTLIIGSGEVQVMTAGSGIRHSEYNPSENKDVSLLQIWIFPDQKELTPRYEQKEFPSGGRKNKLQLLVSPNGREGSLQIHQQAYLSRLHLDKGKSFAYKLFARENCVYCFLIEGEAVVEEEVLQSRDAIGITTNNNFYVGALSDIDILFIEIPKEVNF